MSGEGQENNGPSTGQQVQDAQTAVKSGARAIESGGADIVADVQLAGVAVREGKPVLKALSIGCIIQVLILIFVVLFFIDLFNPSAAPAQEASPGADSELSNWTGSTEVVEKIGSVKIPETEGKVGHEQHASKSRCFKSGNSHYNGALTFLDRVGSVSNCMAFGGNFTTNQERWYFNMRWDTSGNYPSTVRHKKVIVTNPANGKRIVVSIEEYGPAAYLKTRDGIVAGAPPEVYKYLGLKSPYTGDPNDKKGFATFGFAKDQDIPLGPLN